VVTKRRKWGWRNGGGGLVGGVGRGEEEVIGRYGGSKFVVE